MNVMIFNRADEVANFGAEAVLNTVKRKPDAVLGLATGSTPILLYERLIKDFQAGRISFAEVQSFNLDEYLGLAPEHPQSYRYFMEQHFFCHVDIDRSKTHVPSCENQDPEKVCETYEHEIRDAGGIDLQILGIGRNGHIGFNEPHSSFCSRTRIKKLSNATLRDNARFFRHAESQPKYAITMGVGTILEAKKIILLATGEAKAEAVQAAIEGPITNACPASVLQAHPDASLVVDTAAASLLEHHHLYRRQSQDFDMRMSLHSA